MAMMMAPMPSNSLAPIENRRFIWYKFVFWNDETDATPKGFALVQIILMLSWKFAWMVLCISSPGCFYSRRRYYFFGRSLPFVPFLLITLQVKCFGVVDLCKIQSVGWDRVSCLRAVFALYDGMKIIGSEAPLAYFNHGSHDGSDHVTQEPVGLDGKDQQVTIPFPVSLIDITQV